MTSYRYWTADLRTQTVLGDIQLNSVSADASLSQTGNLTGNFPLGKSTDDFYLAATEPGRTALFMDRDDELIWGGIIWDRSWDSDEGQEQLTCATFDSYYSRCVLEQNFIQQNVDTMTISQVLVDRINAQYACDIGITWDGTGTSGTLATVLLPAYEFHYASEVIEQIIEGTNGLEFFCGVEMISGVPVIKFTFRNTNTLNSDRLISLDFPGSVKRYVWDENAMQGGNRHAGRGGGSGNKAPTAIASSLTNIVAGYPSLWQVTNYPDIIDLNLIWLKTELQVVLENVPYVAPSITVHGDAMRGNWQKIGANVKLHIQDKRFPDGKDITRRLYGWSLTAGDENSDERVLLTTNNGDV